MDKLVTTSVFRVEAEELHHLSSAYLVADLDSINPSKIRIGFQKTMRGCIDIFGEITGAVEPQFFDITGVGDNYNAVYHAALATIYSLGVSPIEFSMKTLLESIDFKIES